jgi:hypothetical protein
MLESTGYGKCFEYDDKDGIGDFILNCINKNHETGPNPPPMFSRRNLAGEIASML